MPSAARFDLASTGRFGPLAAPVACGCCLVAGAAYVTAANPSGSGGFIPCPFRSLTGLWCPGCGLTRATHHVFRGDLAQALRYNVFVVLVIVAVVGSWLAWVLRATGRPIVHQRLSGLVASRWLMIGLITLVVGFAVARNLPTIDGLRG